MYEREREVAEAAVTAAAHLARAAQEAVRREQGSVAKPDRSPVTSADLAVQVLIARRLRAAFPDDPLMAEEDPGVLAGADGTLLAQRIAALLEQAGEPVAPDALAAWLDRGAHRGGRTGRFWCLDPIDGTKGFLRGDQFAVALALVEGGEVVVGGLGCPRLELEPGDGGRGAVLVAVRGAGTNAVGLDGAGARPARVDGVTRAADAVFCESVESAHSSHTVSARVARRLGVTAPPARMDSQAKYAMVALGRASLYLRFPRDGYRENLWDHAAGTLVVTEAGGRVSDVEGRPLDFGAGAKLQPLDGIVVSNGGVHDAVVAAVRCELRLT